MSVDFEISRVSAMSVIKSIIILRILLNLIIHEGAHGAHLGNFKVPVPRMTLTLNFSKSQEDTSSMAQARRQRASRPQARS